MLGTFPISILRNSDVMSLVQVIVFLISVKKYDHSTVSNGAGQINFLLIYKILLLVLVTYAQKNRIMVYKGYYCIYSTSVVCRLAEI